MKKSFQLLNAFRSKAFLLTFVRIIKMEIYIFTYLFISSERLHKPNFV